MSATPDAPNDRTEALPPPEGTVDLQPTSPPPTEDATGAWQVEQPDPGATAQLTPGPPEAPADTGTHSEQTGAWQAEPESGGATANFVPGEDPDAVTAPLRLPGSTTARGLRPRPSYPQGTQRRDRDATGGLDEGQTPEAPELQAGRYLLKQFHAKGGMGEIWLAEDCTVGRQVALKKMRGQPRPDQKDEFLREAQITGQLEHPGIVPVHEMGEDESGQPFYVMKFIQGRTLTSLIDEYHATSPNPPLAGGGEGGGSVTHEVQGLRLLQTFLNLCQTVAFAHAQGVIHRDLKPDNVMVGSYGETLLLDWGLAKPTGQADASGSVGHVRYSYSGESLNTLDGSIKGTPSYMAPEVAEGHVAEVDQASDIYLLGGTLYHILTGKRPREAKKVTEFIELARKQPPVPPRQLDRSIPRALDAICQKAMAHRKQDRYASAQALAEDVQRYLAGEPVTAYRENFWERAGRWVKRHRVALGRTVAVLFVLGLVLAGVNELHKAEARREADRVENERKLKMADLELKLEQEQRKREQQDNEFKQAEAARKLKLEQAERAKAQREADERRRREQAGADVVAFRRAADEAHRLVALQDPGTEHLLSPGAEQAERKAGEAAAVLRAWGAGLADLPLPEEQAALKQQLYEMFLVLAETKSRRGTRAEAARDTLAVLDRATALREPTAAHLRLRAECHQLLGEKGKAAEARRKADAPGVPTTALDRFLNAERLRVAQARATEEREQHTWTKGQREQMDQVVEEYRRAIALDYNSFWAHFQLSQCYLILRKEDMALNALDACVALRPDSPWGYTLRGHVLALRRRFGEARADLERAMKLGPQLHEPRLHRGVVNWLEKRYDEALADFESVLKATGKQPLIEAAFYRGQLHLERGDEEKALADFNRVIKERPTGHPASLRRARIYFGRGDVKRGMADLDAFLARGGAFDPDSPAVCAERGRRMRLMLGELPRELRKNHLLLSLAQLNRAIERGARSPGVYDELGAVHEFLGKAPEAVRAYTEAVRLAPKEARLLVKRGWAYERQADLDEAAADFAAALKIDPTHAEAHAGLGYIHACRGKEAGATRHASEAVLHRGGDYLTLHNIACVYGKLSENDPQRAREFQDLALVYLRREVELWRRDRSGPDALALIRAESAFPPALRQRPEFKRLLTGEP
ncbi:MAG: tetratricopeptide repeat protein [Gemmataceae bacterium]|nr:tetratricopeptide repeat protein [Gemmataceae bacterium]